jgi:hypothetical protein
MKLTLLELRNLITPLNSIVAQKTSASFAYKVSRICKIFNDELAVCNKAYEDLALKYCKRNEDESPIINDNQYQIEDIGAFNEEVKELNNQEIDLNISSITLESMDKEGIKITPNDMTFLSPIISGNEE